MTTTITDGATPLVPMLVTGYQSTRQAANILHPIIGRADVDVTLRAAGLRTGTLEMLVDTHADALALEALHAQPLALTLTDTDHAALGMTYVSSGRITVTLDNQTRNKWLVAVEFQEVAPA